MNAASGGEKGDGMAGRDIQAGPARVRYLARHQVMGLAVQFLLGTAVNLIGQPS